MTMCKLLVSNTHNPLECLMNLHLNSIRHFAATSYYDSQVNSYNYVGDVRYYLIFAYLLSLVYSLM